MSGWAADLAEAIKACGRQTGSLMLARVKELQPFKLEVAGELVEKQIYAGQISGLQRGDMLVVWLVGGSFYILTKAVRIV